MPTFQLVQDVFLLLCIPAAAWWTWKLTGGSNTAAAQQQALESARLAVAVGADLAKVQNRLLENRESQIQASDRLTAQLETNRMYAPVIQANQPAHVPSPIETEEDEHPDNGRYQPLGRG